MKNYFKRGLALVLAVALVVSSGLYVSSDRTLKATGEDEMYSEAGAETTQEVVEVQAEQEEAQPVAEAPAEEAPAQEPETTVHEIEIAPEQPQAQEETPAEEPKAEVAEAPAQEETPAQEAQAKAPAAETPVEEEKAAEVCQLHVQAVSGGKVTVSVDGGSAKNAADGLTEEMQKNASVVLHVSADENHEIAAVTANGTALGAVSGDSANASYELKADADTTIAVSFKEKAEEVQQESPKTEEKKDEQKAEEAKEETPAEAEQEEAAEKDLNEMTADELFAYLMTVSGDDMDALYEKYPNLDELTAAFSEEQQQELTAHFGGDQVAELAITGESQVKVGESVTLTGTKSANRNSDHSWRITVGGEYAQITATNKNTVEVTGIAVGGPVTVYHLYNTRDWGWRSEIFTLNVISGVTATSLTVTPESATVAANSTVQLTATVEPSGAAVTWASSDTNIATVDRNGKVTGVKEGTVTITASSGDLVDSSVITVTRDTSLDVADQTAYFYIWKPGTAEGTDYRQAWYYVGTGKVKGPQASESLGGTKYYDWSMIQSYPGSMPDITVDGETYTYDSSPDAPNGTYSVNWAYLVISSGANNGNSVITNDYVYHVDGYAVFKTAGEITVDFQVKQPTVNGFESVDGWPKVYRQGNDVTAPAQSATKTVNNVTYTFDGWYKDQGCTQRATADDFKNLQQSVIFYGKYVANSAAYTVEYYYDEVLNASETIHGNGTQGERIPYSAPATKTVDGTDYTLVRVETPGKLITSSSDNNVIRIYYQGEYRVVYDLNGGTTTSEQTEFGGLHKGDATPTINEPTRAADDTYTYEFAGWSPEVSETVTGNATYVARWTPVYKIFHVTYDWGTPDKAVTDVYDLPTDTTNYHYNDTYQAVTTSYGRVETTDQYGNVNGYYSFSGWSPAEGTITGDVTITGEWTYTSVTVGEHKVYYTWKGLPDAALYNEAGTQIARPEYPKDITGLVNGESYAKKLDTSMPGTVVYTQDEFGNKTGKYTLSAWTDPNNGTMGTTDVNVTGVWKEETIKVEEWHITYEWSGDVPTGDYAQTLPTDGTTYKNNQDYTVDTKYGENYTVTTYDEWNNVTGTYTFSGWDTEDGKITENLTIRGTWKYDKTDVAKHNVNYIWHNFPAGTLYNDEGIVVTPEKPTSITDLVKGQKYTIDKAMPGTIVYTHDDLGNVNAKYELSAWTDPGNGTMGEADITVSATWVKEDVEVKTWKLTYEWTGDVPTGVYAQILPTDDTAYRNNEVFHATNQYPAGYTVTTRDAYGNINGRYEFSGWTPLTGTMTSDRTISGTWKFISQTVEAHEVHYSWGATLPNETLYDADGNELKVRPTEPTDGNKYVNNQTYPVNRDQEGMTVYTRDAYGNTNASYKLSTWTDPNHGTMGNGDVTITSEWVKTEIAVKKWKITYSWDGDIPAGVTLPTNPKEYVNGEEYPIDTTYTSSYTVPTHDQYGNITGEYRFSGWDKAPGIITSNIEVKGTWNYVETELVQYTVEYTWSGLPTGVTLYDADGKETTPEKPESITGLVNGESYAERIDTTMPNTVVYTHDEYGNRTASYTLGKWQDQGTGKINNANGEIKGVWTEEKLDVATWKITYNWKGNVPSGKYAQTLPTDSKTYINGEQYTVDDKFKDGTTVETTDDFGNVNGVYTFHGWNHQTGETITSDLTIEGTWSFETKTVDAHNVTYHWEGLPGEQLYDKDGNKVTPKLPDGKTGLVNNQPYTVDRSQENMVVYTHDQYGNVNAKYTLGTWQDPENGVMKNVNITIEAKWTAEAVDVKTWNITYEWTGTTVPAGVNPPTDSRTYTNRQPYTVDRTFTTGYTVNSYDAYNNVNGVYTFQGWDTADGTITSDLTIKGSWTFTKTDVKQLNVIYSWSGLPENTKLYDEKGNEVTPQLPAGASGLVKNQKYTVDTHVCPAGTKVYTKDAYGNLNVCYTLGDWSASGEITMADSDVEISAQWTPEVIELPDYSITYTWDGDVPTGVNLPTDNTKYKNNQPYTVNTTYGEGYTVNRTDEYGNVNGVYTFSGWDKGNGRINHSDLIIHGTWSLKETTVAQHNVTYTWDLPKGTYYTAAGTQIVPTLPDPHVGLVKNQGYTIDTLRQGMVVYTHDQYGNVNASYTMGNWSDPGNGVMGDDNIVVSGHWTKADVTVQTWKLTYKWSGLKDGEQLYDADGQEITENVKEPVDNRTYINKEPFAAEAGYFDGYQVYTHDQYGNVNGEYTFSGWTPKSGIMTADQTIEGTWTFRETTVTAHQVTYRWSGLPDGVTLYDAAGNTIVPTLPGGTSGLVKGQPYEVNTAGAPAGMQVYTHDKYGNADVCYTLGDWSASGTITMGDSDIEIVAAWTGESVEIPEWKITYFWDGKIPDGVILPTDGTSYKNNQPYEIDKTYTGETKIEVKDAYENVIGIYSFSGWDTKDGKITSNLTVTGIWSYEAKPQTPHKVAYTWSGLPENETLYDGEGNEVTPKLPGDITDLVNNQPYTLDNTLIGTTVYTHDQYGNQTAAYTLNGWVDPNNGIMGTADVEVAGTWTKEEIPVQTHTITYSWSGLPEEPILDADGNDATPKKPEDNRIYTHNAPYSVDTTFPAGYTVTTYDQYGNPNGAYIFSGWDAVETKGYITADLTFKGEWRYEAAEVAKHNVVYSWSGLPEEQLYDADGNPVALAVPASLIGLVNNQPYDVDITYPNMTVYTRDAYGNVNASYTFGSWNDPNNGVMGETNVTVDGTWTKAEIAVAQYTVTYLVDGQVYGAVETYVPGQPIAALRQALTRTGYTFSGWNPSTLPGEDAGAQHYC